MIERIPNVANPTLMTLSEVSPSAFPGLSGTGASLPKTLDINAPSFARTILRLRGVAVNINSEAVAALLRFRSWRAAANEFGGGASTGGAMMIDGARPIATLLAGAFVSTLLLIAVSS